MDFPELPNFPKITPIGLNPINFMPDLPKLEEYRDPYLADAFYKRLTEYIVDFEEGLTENEEVAIKLVSFGESVTIIVEEIGYYNPALISFSGFNLNNQKVQLIQHVNQLSFLLMACKTEEPVKPRERIGFKLKHQNEGE